MAEKCYTVHIDGASRGNPGHSALAVVVTKGEEVILERGAYLGVTTNNVAEYSALIEALSECRRLGLKRIAVKSDSELLVKQMNGQYKVKAEHLRPLHINAIRMVNEFDECSILHIPREQNKSADKLANKVLDDAQGQSIRVPS